MNRGTKISLTALIVTLILFLSLISYEYLVVSPQAQTDMNIRRTSALKGWLILMGQVHDTLEVAKTYKDVLQAADSVGFAGYFTPILYIGSSEKLYISIATATASLYDALRIGIGFGGGQGNISENDLLRIANLTDNLYGLLIRSASLPNQTYPYLVDGLDYSGVGMDPAQQLREVGVNMTNVIDYLNQIEQISRQITP